MSELLEGEDGYAIADDRYFPVVLSKFAGTADVAMMERYFDWMEERFKRARREGKQIVQITDALDVVRPPAPVRDAIARMSDAQKDSYDEFSLGSFIVLDNILVRGTITAINRVSKRGLGLTSCSSVPEAISRAIEAMRDAGFRAPLGLQPEGYHFEGV